MISALSNAMGFTKSGRGSGHEGLGTFFLLQNCVCPFCCSLGRQLGGLMHETSTQTEIKCENLFLKPGSISLIIRYCMLAKLG